MIVTTGTMQNERQRIPHFQKFYSVDEHIPPEICLMRNYKFDFVIIGAGLSGLFSALNASKYGSVALISKTTLEISNSYLAQGGIAAAIDKEDSPSLHISDTINTGRGLCSHNAVEVLVNEGKEIIQSLIEMGMPFDTVDGKLALGLEGGHSKRRVLHAGGDSTGKELVNFILPMVSKEKKIQVYENILAYELIREDENCSGVKCYDFKRQTVFNIKSSCTIIAAGGAAGLYMRTTNPPSSVGEGISLAYNAGAEIESMEFIQFHPTAFYSGNGETFLISEAVRGEGAYLINHEGKRFLADWDSTELSPRDKVSEVIFLELKKSGRKNVFLDLSHLQPLAIKSRFANIYREALKFNIDITSDLIPVAPAAHYMIGGIKTDLNGETNINHLYAAGEAASTGVHGANRLASNSLLECLVFARRAVEHAARQFAVANYTHKDNLHITVNENHRRSLIAVKGKIGEIMWNDVGIIRTKSSLENALYELAKIEKEIVSNEGEYYSGRIKNMIEVAKMIAQSALLREESRGCHNRADFPEEDLNFQKTIVLRKGKEPQLHKI